MNIKHGIQLIFIALLLNFQPVYAFEQCGYWPQWNAFKNNFISEEGRVIDIGSENNITTSEGQSYGLFFALVANDKPMFDKLLNWTEKHLSEGDLSARLPAWLWGKRDNSTYGIIDSNPASDSDIWIAYALAEASELWNDRRYAVLSSVLASRILREETHYLPELGLTLLPAPYGFKIDKSTWKLNPSYAPLMILKRFSQLYDDSPWLELHNASATMLLKSAKKGYSPDWILYSSKKGFHFTRKHNDLGSYNAIRVYLWAGLMADGSMYKRELMNLLEPMAKSISRKGITPLNTYSATGKTSGKGPIGFTSAILPFLEGANKQSAITTQKQKLLLSGSNQLKDRYYDSVLNLFGSGFLEQRYSFDTEGKLITKWELQCE